MVRRTSTWRCFFAPRVSLPCVARRRRSWATTRCTAARSCNGPLGSARSSSFSGRAGGSCSVRSICARSSSRRSSASKRRISSRGSPWRRGSSSGSSGCGSERRPSWRRMRCTSTPMTPDPSPWRPNAAMAIRARSRIAPSSPAASAAAICARSSSTSSEPIALGSMPPSSRTSWRTAAASAARKKKRSKTSSKMRRSSGDFARGAASASRKASVSVHCTSPSAAKASSSSLVPIATSSERSSSANSSSRAASPGWVASAPEGGTDLHPDAIGHDVEVGAVLDDDRHGVAEGLLVDVLGAEQQQGARPVDRLRDRGRLLEVELADELHELDELARDLVVEVGRVQVDDLELVLEARVVEPEIEATALERLGELARVVGGQQHDGLRARLDAAELGDGDLEVREDLQQHRLELLVGLVDLVDEQDDRLGAGDRRHERALEQELLAEDVVLDLVPAGLLAGLGLDAQQLLAVVPLVQRLGLVEALIALQAHEGALQVPAQGLGQLGLADAGRALDEHGLAEARGQERDERGRLAWQVAGLREAVADVVGGGGQRGGHEVLGEYGPHARGLRHPRGAGPCRHGARRPDRHRRARDEDQGLRRAGHRADLPGDRRDGRRRVRRLPPGLERSTHEVPVRGHALLTVRRRLRGIAVDTTALRESRDFRLLEIGGIATGIGTQIGLVALPYQVYVQTRSPLATGAIGIVELVPLVTASLLGGAVADRTDRRRLLLLVQIALALVAGALAALAVAGSPPLAALYVLAGLGAGASAVERVARTSIVPTLVEPEHLRSALSFNFGMYQVTMIIGPALGGLIISAFGLGTAYAVDGATCGFMAIAALMMRPQPPHGTQAGEPVLRSIAEGLRFVWRENGLMGSFAIDLLAMTFGMPRALFPVLALTVYHAGAVGTGALYASVAAGATVAALTTGWLKDARWLGRIVIGAVLVWGASVTVAGLFTSIALAALLFAIAGAADSVSAVCRSTISQTLTPDALRGRMSSVFLLVVAGGPRLGDVESGAVASLASARFSVVSGGVACLAGVGLVALAFPGLAAYDGDQVSATPRL